MLTVVLIDPTPLSQEGLKGMLQDAEAGFEVHAVPGPTSDLMLHGGPPDVVIINLKSEDIPGETAQAAIRSIRAQVPDRPVMALVESDGSSVTAHKALAAGLRGYCPASISMELFVAAVRLVAAGGIFLPPELMLEQAIRPRPTRTNESRAAP